MDRGAPGPLLAIVAAALFGLSAPAAKLLVGAVDPWLLAGLLYLGSGVGLGAYHAAARRRREAAAEAPLRRRDLPWLAGAILTGGVAGPVLLMLALAAGPAAQSSLLLNLEGVFTALLAWIVFREHVDARIAAGMALIAAGALVLGWEPSRVVAADRSALLVAGACLAWAVDNNLTRRISASDAMQIAAVKGAVAGAVNAALALAQGASLPGAGPALAAACVGFVGYGTSLVLFVRALRLLGTARTGAYFATAPFVGAVGGILVLREPVTAQLLVAAAAMAAGVWLHLSERHHHEHDHAAIEHEHLHTHDEHHGHDHAPGTAAREPHSHRHVHEVVRHAHHHFPDLHHRHGHRR